MLKLSIPFYNKKTPNINESVLVKITERTDTHFNGELIEYNQPAFMIYSDASKKKKVTSWNKIVPLNKEIVARVEENSSVIKISISKDEVEKTEQFDKNKILISIFKKLAFEFKKDINELWTEICYKLDEKRRQEDEDKEEIPMLLDYFEKEKVFVKTIIFDEEIYNKLYEFLDKFTQEKPCKIISKIDIISTGNINNTIDCIRIVLDDIKFPYTFKYESAPTYTFESNSLDSSIEDHNKLIFKIKAEGQKYNPKTFVKYKYEVSIINEDNSIKITNFRLPYLISLDELIQYLKESGIQNIIDGNVIKNNGNPDIFLIKFNNKIEKLESISLNITKVLDKKINSVTTI